jgi:hypothetical protein
VAQWSRIGVSYATIAERLQRTGSVLSCLHAQYENRIGRDGIQSLNGVLDKMQNLKALYLVSTVGGGCMCRCTCVRTLRTAITDTIHV